MSKRHKKSKLVFAAGYGYDDGMSVPDFGGDLYEAPRGKKPRGKQKRSQQNHKTAYYD
ncbi:MAG: hypothetical protein ACSHXY_06420 [Alphaproteobacteria bacterium]